MTTNGLPPSIFSPSNSTVRVNAFGFIRKIWSGVPVNEASPIGNARAPHLMPGLRYDVYTAGFRRRQLGPVVSDVVRVRPVHPVVDSVEERDRRLAQRQETRPQGDTRPCANVQQPGDGPIADERCCVQMVHVVAERIRLLLGHEAAESQGAQGTHGCRPEGTEQAQQVGRRRPAILVQQRQRWRQRQATGLPTDPEPMQGPKKQGPPDAFGFWPRWQADGRHQEQVIDPVGIMNRVDAAQVPALPPLLGRIRIGPGPTHTIEWPSRWNEENPMAMRQFSSESTKYRSVSSTDRALKRCFLELLPNLANVSLLHIGHRRASAYPSQSMQ